MCFSLSPRIPLTLTPTTIMTPQARQELLTHLQTGLEIEYSTVPIYLFTYYSINRTPSLPKDWAPARQNQVATLANKAGGLIMSVAVEEMLHMSLVANVMRALGGTPDLNLYQQPSTVYPTPLPHHNPAFNPDPDAKGEFKIPLARLSAHQLGFFLGIEYPEKRDAKPQGDNWDTIGQFYDYIRSRIDQPDVTNADFSHADGRQLAPRGAQGEELGYYNPNNVDTIYPKDAKVLQDAPQNPDSKKLAAAAVYPNARDGGGLVQVVDKASAVLALNTICEQGEGNPEDPRHQFDDGSHQEDTHWYKFSLLQKEMEAARFTPEELGAFVFSFMDNPTLAAYQPKNFVTASNPAPYDYRPFTLLANAAFTYIFQLTQLSYELNGTAQHMVFNIGMHKAMIFILDKVIGAMRYYNLDGNGTSGNGTGPALAPTFENYPFKSLATAKQELAQLFLQAPSDFQQGNPAILQRIQDLPDLVLGGNGEVRF